MKRTWIRWVLALFWLAVLPGAAFSATDARCGLSAGAIVGPSIPADEEIKDEFPYLYHIEVNAKYYLLKVFSISVDLGYEYGQGTPKHFLHEDGQVDLDGRGTSFWRAMPFWGTLRLEVFRKSVFNPYIGAAGGGKYLVMERRGREREIPKANSGDEWLFGWMGIFGFDVMLDEFFFLRAEGRYSSLTSTQDEFFEEKDFGTMDVMVGLNVYF